MFACWVGWSMTQRIGRAGAINAALLAAAILGNKYPDTREALLIDPVRETVERDLQLLKDLDLKLAATLETHVHADHLTGAHSEYQFLMRSRCVSSASHSLLVRRCKLQYR